MLAVTVAPLLLTSVVFMADRPRPDQFVYGRYNDAVMWPVIVLGLNAYGHDAAAVLVVDGDSVIAGEDAAGATVSARVVDEGRGRKIRAFNYKNKSNQRRRWGHRQAYSTIEITGISAG